MGNEKDLLDQALPTDSEIDLPFETKELRDSLSKFLDQLVEDPITKKKVKLGHYRWGVYAFFDYDDEPIYVGQTKETLRTRIRRHLTNQRTDAVAMSVLDPFEVCSIAVWPIPEFQHAGTGDTDVRKKHLDALEYGVFQQLLKDSEFNAILNEKDPPQPQVKIKIPPSHKAKVVPEAVSALRDHPDLRIARRAMTLSRLAQVICERKVGKGLRRVLLTQAKRLQWLADRRCQHAADVEAENGDSED